MNEVVSLLVPLGLGIVMSFTGSLPPGVICFTVMDTAIRKSLRDGLLVAAAASFMEFFQAMIAVFFSSLIVSSPFISKAIQYSAIPVFLLLGLYFLLKKTTPGIPPAKEEYALRSIGKGLMVGAMNMMVIPFWIFWSSYFATNGWIDFRFITVVIFSAGIMTGTFLALALYARLGLSIAGKTASLAFWGRKIIGIVFLAFAVYHLVKLLL